MTYILSEWLQVLHYLNKNMKATLEFNLPEEREEYKRANQSQDMFTAIFDFSEKLRSYRKYGHDFKTADEALDAINVLLHEELSIRYISLHD